MVSSNFAVAFAFTLLTASASVYRLARSTLESAVLKRLLSAMGGSPGCGPAGLLPFAGRAGRQWVEGKEDDQPIVMPIERAVPEIVLIAASRSVVLRSGIFCLAISSSCFCVILPTLFLFGSPDPFSSRAAFMSRMAAG